MTRERKVSADKWAPILTREELHNIVDFLVDVRNAVNNKDASIARDIIDEYNAKKYGFLPRQLSNSEEFTIGLAASISCHETSILVSNCAEWAQNYFIGGILSTETSTERGPCANLESVGFEFSSVNSAPNDSTTAREIIVRLLGLIKVLPYRLDIQLSTALRALNDGEVQELVKPAINSLHGLPFSLIRLKFHAVEYTHYLHGTRKRMADVQDIVAEALSVSAAALKSWEHRDLPKYFTTNACRERWRIAKTAGRLFSENICTLRDIESNQTKIEESPMLVFFAQQRGSHFDLEQFAREFREAVNT